MEKPISLTKVKARDVPSYSGLVPKCSDESRTIVTVFLLSSFDWVADQNPAFVGRCIRINL